MCTVVSETLFYLAEEARRHGLWMVNWDDNNVFGMTSMGVSFLNDLPEEPVPISILIDDGATATAVVDGAETRVVGALPPVKTG